MCLPTINHMATITMSSPIIFNVLEIKLFFRLRHSFHSSVKLGSYEGKHGAKKENQASKTHFNEK